MLQLLTLFVDRNHFTHNGVTSSSDDSANGKFCYLLRAIKDFKALLNQLAGKVMKHH
jgi:hypothetical protein